jgi:3-oxoacyl-[acyl-carrier protein] reductase
MSGPQQQTAIITGVSRERGIGAAICRSLAETGANIFFTSWRPYDSAMPWGDEPGFPEHLAADLRSIGVKADHMEIDLGDVTAAARVLDQAEQLFGQAQILVNNACYSVRDSLDTITAEILDRSYAVNARAPILLSVEFVRRFRDRGARRIVSMTSGQSRSQMVGELAYAITKAAIDAFTLTFATEVGPLGITVNAVDPGPTDTGWMDDESRQKAQTPLGRIGQPDDAARLVRFLVSDEADWISGQVIRSDGGRFVA